MRRSALLAAATVAGAALIGSIAEGDRKSKGGGDYRPLGADASFDDRPHEHASASRA